MLPLFLILLLLCGCDAGPSAPQEQWHQIADRSNNFIYRIKAPSHLGRREEIPVTEDTRFPIAEFSIEPNVVITIHNFPFQKIAPEAQVSRWRNQLTDIDAQSIKVSPQHFGGYVGYLFEAQGSRKSTPTKIMGWALQLAPEHDASVKANYYGKEQDHLEQLRADITIKAVGDPKIMQKYRNDLIKFAQNFELIEELPTLP